MPSLRKIAALSAILLIGFLLASPWLSAPSANSSLPVASAHRVYAVSYGRSSVAESIVFRNGSKRRSVPFQWMFWVIRSGEQIVLVDTGFRDKRMVRKWKIQDFVNPTVRLKQLGITPSMVTDVVLTHSHWDHSGLLGVLGDARIWIQEEEYLYAATRAETQQTKAKGASREDLTILLRAEEDGRLRLVSGTASLIPGITMTLSGGHTPGSQFVTVDSVEGPIIIAGDNTYLYKNNLSHIPIGDASEPERNSRAIKIMHREAGSPFLILPGHDPLVMRYFPEISDGIVEITTRSP